MLNQMRKLADRRNITTVVIFVTLLLIVGWLLRPVIAYIVLPLRPSITNGRTGELPYLVDLSSEYLVKPLLTVGEEMPMLIGSFNNFSPSNDNFAFSGIPDGLGVYETADTNYVYVNHELASNITTPLSSDSSDQINGARVSLMAFDKDWQIIGGKNMIERVLADGQSYTLDTTSGDYLDSQGNVLMGGNGPNFSRFCSGYLAADGFLDLSGAPGPIWFAPEEVGPNGRGWAVYPDGTAVALDGLGRYSKEQVYAASQYRADNETRTVLLSTEDTADSELYLFVGQQTAQDPNGFADGDLYVLRVEDDQGAVYDYETMPENVTLTGKWTAVPDNIALGSGEGLSDWVNESGRSTNFRRLEDIHEDPNQPGTFYFATTGSPNSPPGSPIPDNSLGRLHTFTLNPQDPVGDMDFELVLVAGKTSGLNYDNLTVNSFGQVIIQEDRTITGALIFTTQQRYARVLAFDPGPGTTKFLFEANQAEVDPDSAWDYGNWETSGIIEVGIESKTGKPIYLLNVQAHSLSDPEYVQSGQMVLVVPVVDQDYLPSTFAP